MPPAARITDMHTCPMFTGPVPHVGGPILPPAAPTVLINFLPAATVTTMATCVGPPDMIVKGSAGVFINFLPAARMGDLTAHGGVIVLGSPNVIIGEIGAPSPGAGGLGGVVAGTAVATANPLRTTPSLYSKAGSGIDPKCAAKVAADKKLVADTSARIKKYLGRTPDMNGKHDTGDFGPELRPGDWTACQNRAADMEERGRRFNRYSAALPGARAALNTSEVGDKPGSKAKAMDCVKRLPDTGAGLSTALGLPPGAISDAKLRNDKTGFRAAVYEDQATGKPILVARDTEAQSLVDWKTNTDNGQGLETKQYDAMRDLTSTLKANDVNFDMAGYSKGGGLAQEAGLINTQGNVYVFNSAGIPDESVGRAAGSSLSGLASRTSAFSSQGDFLTFLNQTTDPAQQVTNAEWLQTQLAKDPHLWNPVGLAYLNPASKGADSPDFAAQKSGYIDSLTSLIDEKKADLAAGKSFTLFPPVRANSMDTIPDSGTWQGNLAGANGADPSLGKLYQHQMSVVEPAMEKTVNGDRKAMQDFLAKCP